MKKYLAAGILRAVGCCTAIYLVTSNSMTDREWSYVAQSRAKGETRIYTTEMENAQFVAESVQNLARRVGYRRKCWHGNW